MYNRYTGRQKKRYTLTFNIIFCKYLQKMYTRIVEILLKLALNTNQSINQKNVYFFPLVTTINLYY